jgi:hypothetical protein
MPAFQVERIHQAGRHTEIYVEGRQHHPLAPHRRRHR